MLLMVTSLSFSAEAIDPDPEREALIELAKEKSPNVIWVYENGTEEVMTVDQALEKGWDIMKYDPCLTIGCSGNMPSCPEGECAKCMLILGPNTCQWRCVDAGGDN